MSELELLRELLHTMPHDGNCRYVVPGVEFGRCHRCRFESILSEIEQAIAEHERLEVTAALRECDDDFLHIMEYWNKSENETAMVDALYHIMDVAEAARQRIGASDQHALDRLKAEVREPYSALIEAVRIHLLYCGDVPPENSTSYSALQEAYDALKSGGSK